LSYATFIGYNFFELYSEDNRTYGAVASLGHSSRNYNHLPYRAKAQHFSFKAISEIEEGLGIEVFQAAAMEA
jgi:hypothetical protein